MAELLTAAQMRRAEQAAIASGSVTGLDLMERAGAGVVAAILSEWPALALTAHRAVVLCGPGNNGGDGFVVARLLHLRGWAVEVFLYGDAGKLPPDAKSNHDIWSTLGPVLPLSGGGIDRRRHIPDLCVDAIFGIGQTRPVPWDLAEAVQHLAFTFPEGVPVVAVDIPTGVMSDSGRLVPVAAGPEPGREYPKHTTAETLGVDLTVTFQAAKLGHYLGAGALHCGKVVVADIGLSLSERAPVHVGPDRWAENATQKASERVQLVARPKPLNKAVGDHKYSYGHALILSGPASHGGAARLAARGALRIGAGVVTVGAPEAALPENAAHLDAIMLRRVDGAEDLRHLLTDDRLNALCLGPGLGCDARANALLAEVLGVAGMSRPAPAPAPRPTHDTPDTSGFRGKPATASEFRQAPRADAPALVLDADALTLLSRDASLFAALPAACVLTPHAGEFARLFPDIAERLNAAATEGPACSKVDATREAAARAGCVVLFKGPDTVIADPDGRCTINSAACDRAAPWLATAGSGDVLAGMITGLVARGFPPMRAAETAAWLHVEAALSFGPGLIAEDLPEELPKVFRNLGL